MHVRRFTKTRFDGGVGEVSCLKRVRLKQAMRGFLRATVPAQTGVYAMLNAAGHVIYVGMSKNLRVRLQSYFGSRRGGKKELRIGSQVGWILYQPVAHELIARLRERELIRELNPLYNQQGHPTRMPVGYVQLLNQNASSFKVQENLPKQHAGVWGPIPLTKNTKAAIEGLNMHFGLRDCPKETPMHYAGEEAVPPEATACIRLDLGTCLAPCVGRCSRKSYEREVRRAKSFLNGRSGKVLTDIEAQMKTAGEQQRYEQAAKLRDRLESLTRLGRYLRRFHDWMDRANFIYPIQSVLDNTSKTLWMIVIRGTIQNIIPQPKSIHAKQRVLQILKQAQQHLGGKSTSSMVAQPNDFESGRLLYRWFHTFPDEKRKRRSLNKIRRSLK